MYIDNILNQLRLAVNSVQELVDLLVEDDLNFRPIEEKKSIGELVQHLCELIGADIEISSGASQEYMTQYYEKVKCHSIKEMKNLLQDNFKLLETLYLNMTEVQLNDKVRAYWGVQYSRFEWLIEILVHFTHHRAQLHMLMSHKYKKLPVHLF